MRSGTELSQFRSISFLLFLLTFVGCLVLRGSTAGFPLPRYFSGIVLHPWVLQVPQYVVSVVSSSLTPHRPYS